MNYDSGGGGATNAVTVDRARAREAGTATVSAVVCGTFRQEVAELRRDFDALVAHGCRVLSPATVDWVAEEDGFVFAADELGHTPGAIEERHLRAMQAADLIWLHAPAGYVGRSAAMELGYAHALGLRVFARELPTDITLATLVTGVASPLAAIAATRAEGAPVPSKGLLALQRYYERAATARGWEHEDAEECLQLLEGEITELRAAAATAGPASREAVLEMADVQLYLVHLANIVGADLGQAVADKEQVNTQRFGSVPSRA